MITGIVVALPEEISTLSAKKLSQGGVEILDEHHLLIRSGTGPENARAAACKLIEQGAVRLISWGCAAGIDPALKPGDLMLPDVLVSAAQQTLTADPAWHNHAARVLRGCTITNVSLLESAELVSLSSEKLALHRQTGAQALDMESFAVAQAATEHRIPFLTIRAIADPATFDLPAAIAVSLDEKGEVNLNKLLKFLIFHPYEIPGLIALGLSFYKAKNSLKKAAQNLTAITAFGTLTAGEATAA